MGNGVFSLPQLLITNLRDYSRLTSNLGYDQFADCLLSPLSVVFCLPLTIDNELIANLQRD